MNDFNFQGEWKKDHEREKRAILFENILLLIVAGGLVYLLARVIWFIATFDFCPLYYGISCFSF